MKKFFKDITFGVVCFLSVWFAGELIFDKYKGQNNYSYKYNYVKNNSAIKTLLIGNSHFENGINPYLLGDSVFDFAISGRGRWMGWEVGLAEELYPTMSNLKNVIYPIGYSVPFESPHYRHPIPDNVKEYLYFYTKYMHTPYDRVPEKYLFNSALYFNKMGPNYWRNEEVDSLGYLPFEGQVAGWEKMHNVEDSLFYYGEVAEKCYAEYTGNLIRLAEICQENNIRLIAVTCPCSNTFIRNTRSEVLEMMVAAIDSVRSYYPIEYKNYLEDEEFRADSIYYNASHLNAIGADMFAKRIKRDFEL